MPRGYRGLTTRILEALNPKPPVEGAVEPLEPPVYRSATYAYPPARATVRGKPLKYSREDNPTVAILERLIAALEGAGDALAFNTGMAALATTLLAILEPGSRIVVSREAYGATLTLLETLARKLSLELVKAGPETDEIAEQASVKGTRLVLVETITNPMARVIDVPEVVKAAHDAGALVLVDNTIATPILYQPLRDGADLVAHSLTKYIAGHNDALGGAVAGPKRLLDQVWAMRKLLGTIMDPEQAYLVARGAETLELRVKRHCENARHVAEHLADHPKVTEVYYPGLPGSPSRTRAAEKLLPPGMYGAILSFRIRGGRDEAHRLMARLKLVKPSPSLGATRTLISYPIESSHSTLPPEERKRLGITEDLLRLSIGLEDPNDIAEDLDQALAAI